MWRRAAWTTRRSWAGLPVSVPPYPPPNATVELTRFGGHPDTWDRQSHKEVRPQVHPRVPTRNPLDPVAVFGFVEREKANDDVKPCPHDRRGRAVERAESLGYMANGRFCVVAQRKSICGRSPPYLVTLKA